MSKPWDDCGVESNQAIGGMGGVGGRGVNGYRYWHSVPWPGTGYWVTVPGGPGGRGGNGGDGFGGTLRNASGNVTLINVTMARGSSVPGNGGPPGSPGDYGSGNYGWGFAGSNSRGGNIANESSSVILKNTIVAYGAGGPGYNCYGTVIDNGNNLCSDSSGAFVMATSLNNVDPILASDVGANGGSTPTLALINPSPAINAGDDAAACGTDQRNFPRAGLSDIGAYEFQAPASAISYAWLYTFGLPRNETVDQSDPDCDGMNNLEEWIAGTTPNNADSCLKMLVAEPVEPGLVVRWQSVSGKIYFIERNAGFGADAPFSTLATNIVGQAGTTTYIDTTAVGLGQFYYRAGVQQ